MLTALDLPSRNADWCDRTVRRHRSASVLLHRRSRPQCARVEEICFLPADVQPRDPGQRTGAARRRSASRLLRRQFNSNRPTARNRRNGLSTTSVGSRSPASLPASTATYGELARRLNGEARAVGQACGDNRLPLAIPCHRVVAAAGIGGFAHHRGGAYEGIKRWLLLHEAGRRIAFDVSTVPRRELHR